MESAQVKDKDLKENMSNDTPAKGKEPEAKAPPEPAATLAEVGNTFISLCIELIVIPLSALLPCRLV